MQEVLVRQLETEGWVMRRKEAHHNAFVAINEDPSPVLLILLRFSPCKRKV